jgi:hypothetical protein
MADRPSRPHRQPPSPPQWTQPERDDHLGLSLGVIAAVVVGGLLLFSCYRDFQALNALPADGLSQIVNSQ